ncbi:MAG: phage tail protein [Campylobacteraceae bacterium]|jgi:predicted secreted protein|nr:phage tail protein [Campylobacteraceae bacterium]
MANEKVGRMLVLKEGTAKIAVCQSKSITINNELLDITSDGDSGWRTYLSKVGVKSVDISAEGLLDTTAANLTGSLMYKTLTNGNGGASIIVPLTIEVWDTANPDPSSDPDWTITGNFAIASYEISGGTSEAVTFSATFNSSGQIAMAVVE